MFELRKAVPRLTGGGNNRAPGELTLPTPTVTVRAYARKDWASVGLPLLVSLSHQSTNPCREVRHAAIGHFQRMLLGPQILQHGSSQDVYLVFQQSVLPLIEDLLDDELFQRDPLPGGMPETRLRASALVCRVFLYYLDRLTPDTEDMTKLWVQVLDHLRGLMLIDRRHQSVSNLSSTVPSALCRSA